jgi:hypothetical protein
MTDLTKYLSMAQKKKIEVMYKAYVDEGVKVRIPFIALSIDEPAAVVRKYLLQKYGQNTKQNIYAAECDYISDTGLYKRFTDYYQLYVHQYILMKELNTTVYIIVKYIVHHFDENKRNNELTNLYLFFNQKMHQEWHKKGHKYKGIKEFTYYYINKELEYIASAEQTEELLKYERELREYIMLVEVLEQKQKTLECRNSKVIE